MSEADAKRVIGAKSGALETSKFKNIDFVYSRDKGASCGSVVPFSFQKKTLFENSTETSSTTVCSQKNGADCAIVAETIDDIFSSKKTKRTHGSLSKNEDHSSISNDNVDKLTKKNKTTNLESSIKDDDNVTVSIKPVERTSASDHPQTKIKSESKQNVKFCVTTKDGNDEVKTKSIKSFTVLDAIEDKIGSRPRANSTDHELNLPRRGLCDESLVLASHSWTESPGKCYPRGLVNLGNTCFLNAVLQCLAYIPAFHQSIQVLDVTNRGRSMGNGKSIHAVRKDGVAGPRHGVNAHDHFGLQMIIHLKKLLSNMLCLQKVTNPKVFERGAIAPNAIATLLPKLGRGRQFHYGRQEDAHELLLHLLDAIKDGELKAAGINQDQSGWRSNLPVSRLDETTLVHRLFGGYLRSQIYCSSCNHRSNTYDPFIDLSLEVHAASSVASALKEFTKSERLDTSNQWKCTGCKRYVCAQKQLSVFRPSLSLIIHLKRFAFSGGGFGGKTLSCENYQFKNYKKNNWKMKRGIHSHSASRTKISKAIHFPLNLCLPLSDGRNCEYTLTGVIIHVGQSASSGHYTAFVKKPHSRDWLHADDSNVYTVSEKTVLEQRDAYVLFYRRKKVKMEPTEMSLPRHSVMPPINENERTSKENDETERKRKKCLNERSCLEKNSSNHIVDGNKLDIQTEIKKSITLETHDSKGGENQSEGDQVKTKNQEQKPEDIKLYDFKNPRSVKIEKKCMEQKMMDSNKMNPCPKKTSSKPDKTVVSLENKTEVGLLTSDVKFVLENSSSRGTKSCEQSSFERMNTSKILCKGKEVTTNHAINVEKSNEDALERKITTKKKTTSDTSKKSVYEVLSKSGTKIEINLDRIGKERTTPWSSLPPSKASSNESNIASCDLFPNKVIETWEDEKNSKINKSGTIAAEIRASALKEIKGEEQRLKKAMRIDNWDSMLDAGKKKKVKSKDPIRTGEITMNQSNTFHRIQSSMQAMSRGNKKGHGGYGKKRNPSKFTNSKKRRLR